MSPTKKISKNKVSSSNGLRSNRALVLAIAGFLILASVAVTGLKHRQSIDKSDVATMIFSFDGGGERVFTGQVADSMTVLEALLASAQGANFNVVYKIDAKNNVTVTAIDQDINSKTREWKFYLNRSIINTADINKTYVRAGDIVEAKYQ